jgi:hypothetical protein
MKVSVRWDNAEQTIIRYDFDDLWSWEDFYSTQRIGQEMINQTTHCHPIGTLFVMPHPTMPQNILSNTRTGMSTKHPRVFLIVVVSRNRYVKMLYEILIKLYRPLANEMVRTDTLEEARELLLRGIAERTTP